MGRLEKIVVLTVLFLVAVVLGVALNTDSKPADADGGPLKAGNERAARLKYKQQLAEQGGSANGAAPIGTTGATPPSAPGGLLNSAMQSGDANPVSPQPAAAQTNANPTGATPAGTGTLAGGPAATPGAQTPAQPTGAPASAPQAQAPAPFLVTRDGLEASRTGDVMLYPWKAGDTFASVAQRYYGSKDKASRLRAANEGRLETDIHAGEKIWLPVVDNSIARVAANAGAKIYVVKSGDVLTGISQSVYGTSKSWKKIFDANRDVLADANSLKPGMRLRIPE